MGNQCCDGDRKKNQGNEPNDKEPTADEPLRRDASKIRSRKSTSDGESLKTVNNNSGSLMSEEIDPNAISPLSGNPKTKSSKKASGRKASLPRNSYSDLNYKKIAELYKIPEKFSEERAKTLFKDYHKFNNNPEEEKIKYAGDIYQPGFLLQNKKNIIITNEALYVCEENLEKVVKRIPLHNLKKIYRRGASKVLFLVVYNTRYNESFMMKDERELKSVIELINDAESVTIESMLRFCFFE